VSRPFLRRNELDYVLVARLPPQALLTSKPLVWGSTLLGVGVGVGVGLTTALVEEGLSAAGALEEELLAPTRLLEV